MEKLSSKQILLKISMVLATFIVAWLGGLSTIYTDWTWYESLNKPSFNPPNYLFGIVWPILYLLMAIVSFLNAQTVYRLYLVQLCLNGIWSWIFFVFNGLGLAFLNIVVLILLNVLIVRKLRVKGAWLSFSLYLPYLLWITFAAILNLSILVMN
jgi:tryptophan-rich sensory protein|tara:strand:- start:66 stop:527 length:462 start_codon:yes stop_codon:yes gene_type:complete